MADHGKLRRDDEGSDEVFDTVLQSVARVSEPPRRFPIGCTLLDGRLHVLRRLGEGGMGTVYEAYDHRRCGTVALKALSHLDAASLYAFKNEFRSLANVSHTNLVRLHELFGEGEQWFFTMELLDGDDFAGWVRPAASVPDATSAERALDEARLRAAWPQLIDAIIAIHAAGKLHRDLKPSNVLVTQQGRVVVLDFGLVADAIAGGVGQTLRHYSVTGTPAYMAPEQAAGMPATAASDYYALGVMLFEALTGRLPFAGGGQEMLRDKQRRAAPSVHVCRPDAPSDLVAMCTALLEREPKARPDAEKLKTRFGLTGARPAPQMPLRATGERKPLLGRERELEQLTAAYRATLDGQPVVAWVSGESGIGKSTLVAHFLDELRAGAHATVLSGRCYERESVPFKAFDALVDELSRYLRVQSAERAAALLPRYVFALTRLFPVLSRVDVIAEAPVKPIQDPFELQRHGFAAFHELLVSIRDRQPLVVYIDDLQWSDPDSEKLMRDLFVRRDLVPALFVVSHRNDANASIQRVTDTVTANRNLQSCLLRVGPLDSGSARELARSLMTRRGSDAQDPAGAIARESGGNPFIATELARFANQMPAGRDLETFSLAEVLQARVDRLPAAARGLLHELALIGQPVSVETALEAAGASHDDLDALRSSGLIRAHHVEGHTALECYHDRIRESVSAQLTVDEARGHYEQLAHAMASDSVEDLELQCRCYAEAGQLQPAAECAVRAADAASAALAFEHAARWYERALTLGSYSNSQRLKLTASSADALANAGLGAEAAAAYQRAADLSAGQRAIDLRRRAADQLLAIGNVSDGFRLLQRVCAETKIRLPSGPREALVVFAWSSARLRLRGLDAVPARDLSVRDALRLETARTSVLGLNGYLPIHAASLASDYLRLALECGDRRHVVAALGANAVGRTLLDPKSGWARKLLERMNQLVAEERAPELTGLAATIQSTVAYDRGEFSAARAHAERAIALLRTCYGLSIELDAANLFDQLSASALGDYVYVTRAAPPLIDEAFRRGRIWLAAMLSGNASITAWLAPDDAQGYRDLLDEAHRRWPRRSPRQWPDYALVTGEAMLSLYVGEPEHGVRLLEQERAAHRESLLTRGTGSRSLRLAIGAASCSVASLPEAARRGRTEDVRARTAIVHGTIARLGKSGAPAWLGLAAAFEAGCAFASDEPERALGWLHRAIDLLEPAGVAMHAAAARRRLGQHIGGDEGTRLVSAAEQQLRAQGIANIEAMTEFLCPGCRAA